MSWLMNEKEQEAVMSLSASERYSYSIKRIADWEEIWSLWAKDGWVLSEDNEGNKVIPVWPHEKFATACISGEWTNAKPRMIDLKGWMERWIPGMVRDQRLVCIFPTPRMNGVVVTPERLMNDLADELLKYR